MTWLVDTTVLSELRKGDRANGGVRAWFAAARDEDLFTSVLVLGEIRRGIESLRRRDTAAALALEQWLVRVSSSFSARVLPVDARVADRWGLLNVPDPLPMVDGLLAATALVHDLVLVTRNTRDVATTGARVVDPFVPG
ncbi:MAG TPA: type II toxin-antitoxin system VapC family toxin [Candidatus Eisenbacteria bacterium]|nr:type II toxin-antitoxin system VapC family toxin [Candidatus Eisenbacteria bacterium]